MGKPRKGLKYINWMSVSNEDESEACATTIGRYNATFPRVELDGGDASHNTALLLPRLTTSGSSTRTKLKRVWNKIITRKRMSKTAHITQTADREHVASYYGAEENISCKKNKTCPSVCVSL